jgi:hypothetical protein
MRMWLYQVPEPCQASWLVGVLMPGLVTVPGLVSIPGLVSVPDLHDIQDARIIRLQHVNNSHPGATANRAQPGQGRPPPWAIKQRGAERDGLADVKRGVWVYYRVRPQALRSLGVLIG